MIDFLEYYKTKDHIFGECMSKSDSDLMYIHIPKNASSWTKPNLLDWQWEFYNYHTDNLYHKHALVVLRDPVDRWLSGIAEYMYLKHRDLDLAKISNAMLDLIFERIAFDDHTDQQILFLQNLDLNRCTFFWCDKTYREKFSKFLGQNNMPNEYYKYNFQHVTAEEPVRNNFKKFFTNTINNNSKYLRQLEWYFSKDYKLIESVKFYAG